MNCFTILTLITFFCGCLSVPMSLHLHNINTGARCLDGSSAALYYAQGQQKDKTVVYVQGGGMCQGESLSQAVQDCYKRSSTIYGSSRTYPMHRQSNTTPLLSSDPSINPLYYKWNKVYIPYCDGSLHQGSALLPFQYKGTNLYFRGSNNTQTHFQFLNQKLGLYNANDVVFTGSSAGGIAVYLWGNYLYHKLNNKKLLLIPDSGIFFKNLDMSHNKQKIFRHLKLQANEQKGQIKEQLTGIFAITNVNTTMPMAECMAEKKDQTFCFFAENLVKYLIPPLFVVQSLYDEYALKAMGIKCIVGGSYSVAASNLTNCSKTQLDTIQKYRVKTVRTLQSFSSDPKNAVWGVACLIHTLVMYPNLLTNKNWISPFNNPSQKGKTILEALQDFVKGSQTREYIDNVVYPYNTGCNALPNLELYK